MEKIVELAEVKATLAESPTTVLPRLRLTHLTSIFILCVWMDLDLEEFRTVFRFRSVRHIVFMYFLLFVYICTTVFSSSVSISPPLIRPLGSAFSFVLILNEMQNNASRHFEFLPFVSRFSVPFPGGSSACCLFVRQLCEYVRIFRFVFLFFFIPFSFCLLAFGI